MNLTLCKSAIIYFPGETQAICEASVAELDAEKAILLVDDEYIEDFESEMHITFLDEVRGLVTYLCALSASKKFLTYKGEWKSSVECTFIEVLSTLQRREDFKVKLNLGINVILPDDFEIPEDYTGVTIRNKKPTIKATALNLSAGGIFFETDLNIYENTVSELYLNLTNEQIFKVSFQAIRVVKRELPNSKIMYGFGCKFLNLPLGIETNIRSYVFRKQRETNWL